MEFKLNKKAMRSLVEMGFEEKNVIGALKITGNDQANAVSCSLIYSLIYWRYISHIFKVAFFDSANGCWVKEDLVYKTWMKEWIPLGRFTMQL